MGESSPNLVTLIPGLHEASQIIALPFLALICSLQKASQKTAFQFFAAFYIWP
jgi:hypothetical protein